MAKRKRQRPRSRLEQDSNQLKSAQPVNTTNAVKHSVLEQFYPRVVTLREYLLAKLPTQSKIRYKKVATAGFTKSTASASASSDDGAHNLLLKRMLDTTLIGVPLSEANAADREDKWTAHVSTAHDNSEITCGSILTDTRYSQTEIVDFVIWLLFLQGARLGSWNKHMLCQGYRRGPAFNRHHSKVLNSSISGLSRLYENQYVEDLKSSIWLDILRLLGRGGDLIMIDLLVDCAIFRHVEGGRGIYYQISGLPLGDLKALDHPPAKPELTVEFRSTVAAKPEEKTPAAILFVRNRFLYARPVLNSRGAVTFGLRHIHVLNRFPYEPANSDGRKLGQGETQYLSKIHPNSAYVMMYIFPRQFGLHNVFTSTLDTRETVQLFEDYTVRENEINARGNSSKNKVPKRLRGEAAKLVQKLQILHQRCPYNALLRYYCSPVERPAFSSSHDTTIESSEIFKTQKPLSQSKIRIPTSDDSQLKIETPKVNVISYATPVAHVSALCRSVLSRIIPDNFWGVDEDQAHNKKILLHNVDRFLHLRRFESMSLHDVAQGIRLSAIPWLASHNKTAKGCQSDTRKRQELFLEFLYYVFDSLLIPLIRCNFHVTESSVHRYRIFFFRHDVWRRLAEPAMAKIKNSMFEELDTATALRILDTRKLGFSQLRLLPKENGVRPIMNLRRRPPKKGTKLLGQSINSILAPVYNMLTYEKEQNPQKFGSTLFSVGDLYHKLKTFKASLGDSTTRFYLCKVDVQSAFDTIPQDAVVRLAAELPANSSYEFSKHVEVKPGDGHGLSMPGAKRAKPSRKWVSLASTRKDALPFATRVEKVIGPKQKNTVFVGNVGVQTHSKNVLVSLLTEHVQRNLVKIGKKYYRQKNGIPQGSVLSSLLCNYFYADLEAKYLYFLDPKESLLLRLIDDFLLITTNPTHATRFLQIMHTGVPDYGVTVSPHKTLVNFEITINNQKLPRLIDSQAFPYCGILINTHTLYISKNRSSRPDAVIADSLTVEYSRQPGQTFTRKVLNTFKIQAHAMFLDTSHNSAFVVSRNLYEIFEESANKMVAYIKCLPRHKRPGEVLMKRTLERLEGLAWVLIRSKAQTGRGKEAEFRCRVRREEVCWLCWMAFRKVLGERQSAFGRVVEWLKLQMEGPKVRKFRDRRPPL